MLIKVPFRMTIAQIHQMDDTIEKLKTEHNEKKKAKEETVKSRSKSNCQQFFNPKIFHCRPGRCPD